MNDLSIWEERFQFLTALLISSTLKLTSERISTSCPMLSDSDISHGSGQSRTGEEHEVNSGGGSNIGELDRSSTGVLANREDLKRRTITCGRIRNYSRWDLLTAITSDKPD